MFVLRAAPMGHTHTPLAPSLETSHTALHTHRSPRDERLREAISLISNASNMVSTSSTMTWRTSPRKSDPLSTSCSSRPGVATSTSTGRESIPTRSGREAGCARGWRGERLAQGEAGAGSGWRGESCAERELRRRSLDAPLGPRRLDPGALCASWREVHLLRAGDNSTPLRSEIKL